MIKRAAYKEVSIQDKNYRITPPSKKVRLGIRELLQHRELIFVMVWREILIRYKQTLIGSAWVLIQPIITVGVFVVLFNQIMNVDTRGIPYVLFALCGIVPWIYFTHALTKSSYSLLENQNILRKTYFPRIVLPIAGVLSGLIDFAIALVLMFVGLLIYQIPIGINFLFFPLFVLLIVLFSLAVGLWVSSINIQYRDINNIFPFLIQIGLFITPIGYPLEMASEKWRFIFGFNPLTGAIEGLRWSILGTGFPGWSILLQSVSITVLLLISGLYFFKKKEKNLTDFL